MMANPQMVRAAHGVLAALMIGALSAGLPIVPQAEAGEIEQLKTSLSIVPGDAAFYNSMLRNREQIEAIAGSRAWAKLRALPFAQAGLAMYEMQALDPETVPGKIQAALENPQNRELIDLAAEMFSEEIFFYGDESFVGFMELVQQIGGAVRYGPALMQLSGEAEGIDQDKLQAMMLLAALAENVDLVRVPNMVVGFKLRDRDRATEQLTRLEKLASAALESEPEMEGRFKRTRVDGHEYLTLSLDGTLVPWDELPLDELREIETSEGDVEKLIARLKESTLAIALGLRDDYLLVSIGSSTDCLARLGKGTRLIDRPELRPLEKFADRRLTAVSYVSKPMMAGLGTRKKDVDDLLGLLDEVLSEVKLHPQQEARIRKDAAALADDLKGLIPEPGAVMGFSFLTDQGVEGYQYAWGDQSAWDGSKPLGILRHLGGNPLLAVVGRGRHSPEEYDLLVKWTRIAYGYFKEFAVPEMSDEEREQFEEFAELAGPLLRRLDKANREMLIPALADGQAGFVLDGKLRTRQLVRILPPTDQPMPMIEPAVVIGVSDAKLLLGACREYRAVLTGLLDAVRQIEPDAVPKQFTIPEPEVTESRLGTVYSFRLPAEWGLDEKIVPNFGLSETVAVLSASHDHTRRLLRATPLEVGGVLAESDRPLAMAAVLDWAALIDAVTPWVDLVVEMTAAAPPGGDPAQPDSIRSQVHTVLEVLKVLRSVTSESYFEDGALVTHTLTRIRDVPK